MHENQLEHINHQAREWFTLMQSGSISELEKQGLQAWLHESPAHQRAYDEYQLIWQELGNLQEQEKTALKRSVNISVFDLLAKKISVFIFRIASPKIGIAFATTCALLVGLVLLVSPEKITPQNFSTTTGEIKTWVLADGSEITLGAKSEINTWITIKERHVTLINGQAFFKVAKNPQKPFWVTAGQTKIRVVGTQFDVRRGIDRTRIAVLEGIVNVSGDKSTTHVVLNAAQQVAHLNTGVFETINTVSASEIESWRNGRLFYLRANLADVVADANRYFKQSIKLGSKDLAELKVTAAVSTQDINALLDMLTTSLPVASYIDNQNNVVIVSRKNTGDAIKNLK